MSTSEKEKLNEDGLPIGRGLTPEEVTAYLVKQRKASKPSASTAKAKATPKEKATGIKAKPKKVAK